MIQLVIVDDEKIEIEFIKSSIDFGGLGITGVYEANCLNDAKEIMESHDIDILLCDIEMPQGNGLELVTWIREHYPKIECIFLTCHADFKYARQAIKLGSMDYLLKPSSPEEITTVLSKAVNKIRNEDSDKNYGRLSRLWLRHEPEVLERFLLDILNEPTYSECSRIKEAAETIGYPGLEEIELIPVMIVSSDWNEELDKRERKLLELSIRSLAREKILNGTGNGILLELSAYAFLALVNLEISSFHDLHQIHNRCKHYVDVCSNNKECTISCYISDVIRPYELGETVKSMAKLEKRDSRGKKRVHMLSLPEKKTDAIAVLDINTWLVMLNYRMHKQIVSQMKSLIQKIKSKQQYDYDVLYRLKQDFLQIVYIFLEQKGIQAHQLFSDYQSTELFLLSVRSEAHFIRWVDHVAKKSVHCASDKLKLSVVDKVKDYVALNMNRKITCKEIAEHVCLNSIYLNRIFKRTTGLTLSDFIAQRRLETAKELLRETTLSISTVAESIGYSNFSYFSRMFKNGTGESPVAFRKRILTQ